MEIMEINDIENQIIEGKYKKQCTIYLCIPLYWCYFKFDLSFYHNLTHYAQSLFCAFVTNK